MSTLESDNTLLARLTQDGDEQAFAALMQRYAAMVYGAAVRVLDNPTLAEEATQETFFRLLREARQIRQSVGGWLHRTATTVAIDLRRSEKARRAREITASQNRPIQHWRDLAPLLDEALADLPPDQQHLLIAHYLQGTPQRELAQQQKVSAATLHRQMQAALARLKHELDKRGALVVLPLLGLLLPQAHVASPPPQVTAALGKLHLAASAGVIAAGPASAGAAALSAKLPTVLTISAVVGLAAVVGLFVAISHFNAQAQRLQQDQQHRALPGGPEQEATAADEGTPTLKATPTPAMTMDAWPDPARGRFLRVPDIPTPGPSHLIVLFEHPARARADQLTVCYADGHVTHMTLATLRASLERQTGKSLAVLLPRLQSVDDAGVR